MKLKIVFKYKFEEQMKKQFGAFTNPQVFHGIECVYMEEGYLCSCWSMDDIARFYCEEE